MHHIMRKYQKHLLIAGAVLIIPSFVLWGGSFGKSKTNREKGQEPAVAKVGERPVYTQDLRFRLTEEVQRRSGYGQQTTMAQLAQDGTAERILTNLVSRAILDEESERLGYQFEQKFLEDQLKEFPDFQDDDGNFDPRAWNSFLDSYQGDWNALYARARRVALDSLIREEAMASARVLEGDVRRVFNEERTSIQVRHAVIAPAVEPTDEQIQAEYDAHPESYQFPEERTAEFVAVSLTPPRPEIVDELVRRARDGEDFAELAREHSQGATKGEGGDLGWMADALTRPDYQKPIFALEEGEVSDPVEGPAGYHIYFAEETRTNDESGLREVHAREIRITPTLTPEERAAREKLAEELAAAAAEGGDLQTAAANAGIDVLATNSFSRASFAIDNIPPEDAGAFRQAVFDLEDGAVSEVIPARRRLYIARLTGITAPRQKSLEEAGDQVVEDAERTIRQSEEYAAQVADMARTINEKAETLEDIARLFSDLEFTVQDTPPFTIKDYDFQTMPPWNARAIFAAIEGVEPGALVGPVSDFFGQTYFLELVARTTPDSETLEAEWEQEKEVLEEQALRAAQYARFDDYLLDLRQRVPWEMNQAEFLRALGIQPEAPAEDGSLDAEAVPGSDAAAQGETAAAPVASDDGRAAEPKEATE